MLYLKASEVIMTRLEKVEICIVEVWETSILGEKMKDWYPIDKYSNTEEV